MQPSSALKTVAKQTSSTSCSSHETNLDYSEISNDKTCMELYNKRQIIHEKLQSIYTKRTRDTFRVGYGCFSLFEGEQWLPSGYDTIKSSCIDENRFSNSCLIDSGGIESFTSTSTDDTDKIASTTSTNDHRNRISTSNHTIGSNQWDSKMLSRMIGMKKEEWDSILSTAASSNENTFQSSLLRQYRTKLQDNGVESDQTFFKPLIGADLDYLLLCERDNTYSYSMPEFEQLYFRDVNVISDLWPSLCHDIENNTEDRKQGSKLVEGSNRSKLVGNATEGTSGEPVKQSESHWDFVLREAQWMAADFADERKRKRVRAKKIASATLAAFERMQKRSIAKARADEMHRRRRATKISKHVMLYWRKIDKLVIWKHRSRLEAMRRQAMDKHLAFLVHQTERYTQMIAGEVQSSQDVDNSMMLENQPEQDRKSIASDASASNTDSEDFSEDVNETDDEQTLAAEEAQHAKERRPKTRSNTCDSSEDELDVLKRENEMSLDELRKTYGLEVENAESESIKGKNMTDNASGKVANGDNRSETDSEDFSDDIDETDDEETLEAEEAQHTKEKERKRHTRTREADSSDDEIDALQRENEMSLDELRSLYGIHQQGDETEDEPKQIKTQSTKRQRICSSTGSSTNNRAHPTPKENVSAPDDNALSSDDDVLSSVTSEADDETTLAQQEAHEFPDDVDAKAEIDELQREGDLSIEDLKAMYDVQTDEDKASKSVSSHSEVPEEEEVDETDESVIFSDEEDDETTLQAQETDEANNEHEHANELQELQDENEMTIEELKQKYGIEDQLNDAEERTSTTGNDTSDKVAKSDYYADTNSGQSGQRHSKTDKKEQEPAGTIPIPFLLRNGNRLRSYQREGLDWLVFLHDRRLNGILADEMGLGKTIQTISLLAHLAGSRAIWGPHLIVVPTSTILNWEMELKRWCPSFKVMSYYGSTKERKTKREGWTKPNAFHVCITSYQLAVRDASIFRRKRWYYLILDEAHYIKNFKSQRWQTLLAFNARRRLLLTGTPLQNNLLELWSLMHFLMPQLFRSQAEFKEWFSTPLTAHVEGTSQVDAQLVKRLHSVLRPFVLRRLKSEVAFQLPGKFEHIVMCQLSKRQRLLYEEYMSRSSTRTALASGSYMSMMNVLMQLRKVCNHPDLFEPRAIVSPLALPQIILPLPSIAVPYDARVIAPGESKSTFLGGGILCSRLAWLSDGISSFGTTWQSARDVAQYEQQQLNFALMDVGGNTKPVGEHQVNLQTARHSQKCISKNRSLKYVGGRRHVQQLGLYTLGSECNAYTVRDSTRPLNAVYTKSTTQMTCASCFQNNSRTFEAFGGFLGIGHLEQSGMTRYVANRIWELTAPTLSDEYIPTIENTSQRYAMDAFDSISVTDRPMLPKLRTALEAFRDLNTPNDFGAMNESGGHPEKQLPMRKIFEVLMNEFATYSSNFSMDVNHVVAAVVAAGMDSSEFMNTPNKTPGEILISDEPPKGIRAETKATNKAIQTYKEALCDMLVKLTQLADPSVDLHLRELALLQKDVLAYVLGQLQTYSLTEFSPADPMTFSHTLIAFHAIFTLKRHIEILAAHKLRTTVSKMNAQALCNIVYGEDLHRACYIGPSPTTETIWLRKGLWRQIPRLSTRVAAIRHPIAPWKKNISSNPATDHSQTPSTVTGKAHTNTSVENHQSVWMYSNALSQMIKSLDDLYGQYLWWMPKFACVISKATAICPAVEVACIRPQLPRKANIMLPYSRPAGPARVTMHHMPSSSVAAVYSSLLRHKIPLHPLEICSRVAFPDKRLLQFDCGKLQTLSELFRERKAGGHRCLLFTQMTRMLDVLEGFMNLLGLTYLRLDGSTGVEERQRLMDRFNEDTRVFAFILSTRSGGLGINLTGADTVIFYDSDWNPSMDAQAQDRAHRIGQTRDVHIYRLITQSTVEENILRKAKQKAEIARLSLEAGNFTMNGLRTHTQTEASTNDTKTPSTAAGVSLNLGISSKNDLRAIMTGTEDTEDKSVTAKESTDDLNAAMEAAEDVADVAAGRTLRAEIDAEAAEFDESATSNTVGAAEDTSKRDATLVNGSKSDTSKHLNVESDQVHEEEEDTDDARSSSSSRGPTNRTAAAEDDDDLLSGVKGLTDIAEEIPEEATTNADVDQSISFVDRVAIAKQRFEQIKARLSNADGYALTYREAIEPHPWVAPDVLKEMESQFELQEEAWELEQLRRAREEEEAEHLADLELIKFTGISSDTAKSQQDTTKFRQEAMARGARLYRQRLAQLKSKMLERSISGAAWELRRDIDTGRLFYLNSDSHESRWSKPSVLRRNDERSAARAFGWGPLLGISSIALSIFRCLHPVFDRPNVSAVCRYWAVASLHPALTHYVANGSPASSAMTKKASNSSSVTKKHNDSNTSSSDKQCDANQEASRSQQSQQMKRNTSQRHWTSLQEAVTSALSGETIILSIGAHMINGPLVIRKRLRILAEGAPVFVGAERINSSDTDWHLCYVPEGTRWVHTHELDRLEATGHVLHNVQELTEEHPRWTASGPFYLSLRLGEACGVSPVTVGTHLNGQTLLLNTSSMPRLHSYGTSINSSFVPITTSISSSDERCVVRTMGPIVWKARTGVLAGIALRRIGHIRSRLSYTMDQSKPFTESQNDISSGTQHSSSNPMMRRLAPRRDFPNVLVLAPQSSVSIARCDIRGFGPIGACISVFGGTNMHPTRLRIISSRLHGAPKKGGASGIVLMGSNIRTTIVGCTMKGFGNSGVSLIHSHAPENISVLIRKTEILGCIGAAVRIIHPVIDHDTTKSLSIGTATGQSHVKESMKDTQSTLTKTVNLNANDQDSMETVSNNTALEMEMTTKQKKKEEEQTALETEKTKQETKKEEQTALEMEMTKQKKKEEMKQSTQVSTLKKQNDNDDLHKCEPIQCNKTKKEQNMDHDGHISSPLFGAALVVDMCRFIDNGGGSFDLSTQQSWYGWRDSDDYDLSGNRIDRAQQLLRDTPLFPSLNLNDDHSTFSSTIDESTKSEENKLEKTYFWNSKCIHVVCRWSDTDIPFDTQSTTSSTKYTLVPMMKPSHNTSHQMSHQVSHKISGVTSDQTSHNASHKTSDMRVDNNETVPGNRILEESDLQLKTPTKPILDNSSSHTTRPRTRGRSKLIQEQNRKVANETKMETDNQTLDYHTIENQKLDQQTVDNQTLDPKTADSDISKDQDQIPYIRVHVAHGDTLQFVQAIRGAMQYHQKTKPSTSEKNIRTFTSLNTWLKQMGDNAIHNAMTYSSHSTMEGFKRDSTDTKDEIVSSSAMKKRRI